LAVRTLLFHYKKKQFYKCTQDLYLNVFSNI